MSLLGYAWGYIGGGLLFLLNVVMLLNPSLFGLESLIQSVKWSFITVSIWWFSFSLPLLTLSTTIPSSTLISLSHIINVFKKNKALKLFLIAYWFYMDGIWTITKLAVDYGLNLGFSSSHLISALLITQLVGFPATYLMLFISRK